MFRWKKSGRLDFERPKCKNLRAGDSMIVKSVMTKEPICINQDASLTEAKALMNKNNISKLPVLDKSSKLVGILTKNDLNKASPSEATTLDMFEIGYLLSKLTVSKVMSKKVITVNENEIVEEAARIMVDNQIGCIPVMNGEMISGIVTESDLFHLFTDMFGARKSGVRATLCMDDKPGMIACLSAEIADIKGNIISLVTRDAQDENKRKVTIKVTGISEPELKVILKKLNIEIEDIRIA